MATQIVTGGFDPLSVYPVGSIYLSVNSTNPSDLFGGTWTQLKDRFLLAAGDAYVVGSTGGEEQHTHKYGIQIGSYYGAATVDMDAKSGALQGGTGEPTGMVNPVDSNATINNSFTNSGNITSVAHFKSIADTSSASNLPPYLAVYMWQRTA